MSSVRLQNCLRQLRAKAGDKKSAQGTYFRLFNVLVSFTEANAYIIYFKETLL